MRWSSSVSFFGLITVCLCVTNPEEYVNTLGGTQSRFDLSHGNVLPMVTRPWGFNAWSPQTDVDEGTFYFHPDSRRIYGVRCTHQPSPWIADYGNFLIKPYIPEALRYDPGQYSGYNPKTSTWKPYLFNTSLLAYSTLEGTTNIEVTATTHAAIVRVTFPPYNASSAYGRTRRVMVVLNDPKKDAISANANDGSLSGGTAKNSGGIPPNGKFFHYFHLTVDSPVADAQTVVQEKDNEIYGYLDFDGTDESTRTVIIRVATSFISSDQAMLNMDEVNGRSFDEVVKESQDEWRTTLLQANVVDVGQTYSPKEQQDLLEIFYTSLYRATLFPRLMWEKDATGKLVHYSPYDHEGRVFPGGVSTDSGFWDAYRTVYPQLSLLFPEQLGRLMQGWVNAYKEGGWLPKWGSPGYRGGMVGTMGDVSLADAIVKNIPGFDRETAYEAIRQDAFKVPPRAPDFRAGVGRVSLADYMKFGYVPYDGGSTAGLVSETVSRTMNYALSDWAIAQAATALNKTDDAALLMNRSLGYKVLFDGKAGTVSQGFFRAKSSSGHFKADFDEFSWGGDYTEASAWQYRFYAPHDVAGLLQLYGGKAELCSALEAVNKVPGIFHIGAYGSEIHEQTEMALLCWGQYSHNNQPSHHILYTSIAAGCPSQGQFWLRQALTRLHFSGPGMYCGDEDNGELGSWYVLTALGLYSFAPGSTGYILGSPLFSDVRVPLRGGKELRVVAHNNTAGSPYVSSVQWNGTLLQRLVVDYSVLMQGGTLEFFMSPSPPGRA